MVSDLSGLAKYGQGQFTRTSGSTLTNLIHLLLRKQAKRQKPKMFPAPHIYHVYNISWIIHNYLPQGLSLHFFDWCKQESYDAFKYFYEMIYAFFIRIWKNERSMHTVSLLYFGQSSTALSICVKTSKIKFEHFEQDGRKIVNITRLGGNR